MAKKKINIKSVTSDVPSGDVNITYKNTRIAALSESTTAVLETEDTICEDDIEVEYTKPATNYTRTLTVNGNDNYDYQMRIPCIYTDIGGVKYAGWKSGDNVTTVLTGDADAINCIVESIAEAEGSKTHPYNVTGSCVTSYNRTTGKLILNPNGDTFEITIVANNK